MTTRTVLVTSKFDSKRSNEIIMLLVFNASEIPLDLSQCHVDTEVTTQRMEDLFCLHGCVKYEVSYLFIPILIFLFVTLVTLEHDR